MSTQYNGHIYRPAFINHNTYLIEDESIEKKGGWLLTSAHRFGFRQLKSSANLCITPFQINKFSINEFQCGVCYRCTYVISACDDVWRRRERGFISRSRLSLDIGRGADVLLCKTVLFPPWMIYYYCLFWEWNQGCLLSGLNHCS